jgi:hypothetical protein
MRIKPGYFSHHEKAIYEYNSTGDVSKITIYGYDEFDENRWVTEEEYTYDNQKVPNGHTQPQLFHRANSYVTPSINYFANIVPTHNIVGLAYTTTYDWLDGPPAEVKMSSVFVYDQYGYPVKEIISNKDLNAYYPHDGTINEFIYESY